MFQLFRRLGGGISFRAPSEFPFSPLNFPFPHADPDAFATRGENLDFISAYADFIAPPIRCGVAVTALRCRDGARLDGACSPKTDGSQRRIRLFLRTHDTGMCHPVPVRHRRGTVINSELLRPVRGQAEDVVSQGQLYPV
jgi:hypothetical protein